VKQQNKMGGYRHGSGRPKGTGRYGEPTHPLRIPESLLSKVKWLLENNEHETPSIYSIPLYSSRIAAGYPFPVDDHIEHHLDLNQHLIQKPTTTFLVRVEGDSMIGAGIHDNDILIVDRSLEIYDGKIVIAMLNGELTVKRFRKRKGNAYLQPENPKYPAIPLTEESNFHIWGVVIHVIHSL
jgi:DNA polymerase V